MRIKTYLIIISGLLLASCAAYPPKRSAVSLLTTDDTMRQAETQLADASISIKNSLFELAKIQKAAYPAVKLPGLPDADKLGMGHLASIDWTGPIEPLLKNTAGVTYYKLRVLGKAPSIPIIISLSEQKVPIATILRNAAYQCGNRATIVVYPRSRIIELRYARM